MVHQQMEWEFAEKEAWALRRQKGIRLFEQVATRDPADTLREISWREFEQLVGEAFRRQRYSVHPRGGDGPDGGVSFSRYNYYQNTL